MANLKLVQGSGHGRTYHIDGTSTTIGRHESCDVQVVDTAISSEHARIEYQHGKFFLEDLNSKNGTFLNSIIAEGRCELHDADEIRLCDFKFRFDLDEDSSSLKSETCRQGDVGQDTARTDRTIRSTQSEFIDEHENLKVVARLDAGSDSSTLRLASNPQAKLSAVLELSRDIFKVLTQEESTARILDTAFKTFPQTDEGAVILFDAATGELAVSAARPLHQDSNVNVANTFSTTVALAAINKNEAVLIDDAADDSRFNMADSIKILKTKSMMCAPLPDRSGNSVGAIQIYTTSRERCFSNDDLDVLVSLASQASLSLQNVQLHETVRRLNAELSHAARLSTVGEMVSGITHELHQPLAVISNYASACKRCVQKQSLDTDRLIDSLQAISDEALRAGEIMRSIRDVLKKKDPQRENEDLNSIVDEAVKLVTVGTHNHYVRILRVLNPARPLVHVNRIQVVQVIINLLMNAIEAMADSNTENKSVTVKTRTIDEDFAELAVIDAGPGIPESNTDRIFEQFVTTKTDGLGFGLSISKSIVEAHNGTIDFESKPSGGTTFRCTLPLAQSDQPAAPEAGPKSVEA